MAQNTNLNVTPYYDDFDKTKNFYRVLFRPGYPIQARELTTMQSVLQNQVESVGSHLFKDGAMVIPGQVGYDTNVDCILLQESFLGANVEDYRSQLDGKIIQGLTTGVKAKVLYSISATDSDKGYITLYVKYTESGGTANTQQTFSNNEQLVTTSAITFGTTLIEIGSPFAQLLPTAALQKGSVAYVQTGVYYIRGFFVDVPYQYILLDQYGSNPSYRVGLDIQESIITPEDDLSLNDNAAGTSNYAAPGSHRFRITTKLIKKLLTDDADKNFIELLRINASKVEKLLDRSAYDELEKSLAIRTYEESGDYIVKDFAINLRENLDDGFNNGVYAIGATTAQEGTASESKYAVEFGSGAAYVKGYRVKTLSPSYVDLDKPRDTKAAQNVIIPFEMGNWSKVSNVYGFLNLSGSTVSNSYQVLELRDNFSVTAGDAQGQLIGYARTAAFEHMADPDTTFGTADDQYKLNIFDVQMFTVVTLSSNKTIAQGSLLVGANTGARGYIVDAITNSDDLILYQVEGTFEKGEMLTLDGESLDTIANFHEYKYSDTRQFVSRDESTNAVEFTADIILEDIIRLEGDTFTYDATGGSEKITGLNSNFALDLRPGDRIYFNAEDYVDVDFVTISNLAGTGMQAIFNYAAQTVNVTPGAGAAAPAAGTYTTLVRYRGKLNDVQNADLLSEMPKKYIKSISDESCVVRRTFDAQTVASNSVSITLPANEQFETITNENYTFTVLAGTNSTHPVGDQILIDTTNSGNLGYTTFTSADRTTIQIVNLTNITSIKVTATISKNVTARKTKSGQQMFVMKVNKTTSNLDKQNYGLTYSNLYGTRIQDRDLSLGLVDAYRLHAVYESNDDNDPIIPSITLVEPVFFATGSVVTGKTSKARAKVVDFASGSLTLSLVYIEGNFVAGETITGVNSSGTSITAIINDSAGSIVAGSKVVTDNYFLEVGQTGFMYDMSKIVRKKGVSTPIRKLKVVLDYYTHSATGDYFGGQSYLDTPYADIPFYQFKFLADYLDFRPGAKNLFSGTGSVASPAYVNCSTFDFKSRVFTTGGSPIATIFDIPKLNSTFRADFDWYLPRVDKAFLTPDGEFQIIKGKSEEAPQEPDDLVDGMLLAVINHKPYGFDPEADAAIVRSDHKRYTMKDIGQLERRLDQVEYYTSLNMLETDTFNTKVLDASGKDRLKNGFIVDDFSDHGKSATDHEDFAASVDFQEGECRPSHYTTNIPLQINTTLSTNYKQTGPIITLPYVEKKVIDQPYASRVENVNPFNVFTYIGRVTLLPSSDDWVDTERLPARVQQIEGDFEATASELNVDQNGFAPVQWRAWRTVWSADTTISGRTVHNRHWLEEDRGRSPNPGVWGGRGMRRINRVTTIESNRIQTRSGIRTRVIPRIERTSMGDSIVSSTVIPWIRSRNLEVDIARLKPRTQFYTFFDGRGVDTYVSPKLIELIKDPTVDTRTNSTPFVVGETVTGLTSGLKFKVANPNDFYQYSPYDDTTLPSSYASTTEYLNIDTDALAKQAVGQYYGNMQVGEVLEGTSGAKAVVKDRRLISDRFGKLKASFFIPRPGVDTNPRWRTGTRTLRFTTSDVDSRVGGVVASSAEAEYESNGTLNRVRENILAVRNAEVVRDTVNETRTVRTTRTETRQIGWYDPLAQSFILDEKGGVFLTSVDVFFNTKDTNIPVSMQIRTMENGYPTKTILPFSDITVTPDQIEISETASVKTNFKFKAPVYIKSSTEYCFVLLSDSNEYKIWISRMGDVDVTGTRTISEQPYAGVLFKSQNASTWTADQYEDLKFTIYRANFTKDKGTVVLNNTPQGKGNGGIHRLINNPIQTIKPKQVLSLDPATTQYTFTDGARVTQTGTNATATVVSSTTSGSVADTVTVTDITGNWLDGSTYILTSYQAEATITVGSGTGSLQVGDTVVGGTSGIQGLVKSYVGATLILTNVTGSFTASESLSETGGFTGTVSNVTYSGDSRGAYLTSVPTFAADDKEVLVYHRNHCMHNRTNNVTVEGAISEIADTVLTSALSVGTMTINLEDGSDFHDIVNGAAISASNPGYLMIGDEIIQYSAIALDGKSITVATGGRGANSTTEVAHASGDVVKCYNLDGIPLIDINKTHTSISCPWLDTYMLHITGVATNGIRGGGENIWASQNTQFETLTPNISTMDLPETGITTTVNTTSATSIGDGSTSVDQASFVNDGTYVPITLNNMNFFDNPRMICSEVNELAKLSGTKSLTMRIQLSTEKESLSPVVDLDRCSLITTMNRINKWPGGPEAYGQQNNIDTSQDVSVLPFGDQNDAVYITRLARLARESRSIRVDFQMSRPPQSEVRVYYRVFMTGSGDDVDSVGWTLMPAPLQYDDSPSEEILWKDYYYETSGLNFNAFQLKIVMRSSNQARIPLIADLRAICLAT